MPLAFESYPHILDAIVASAPSSALPSLRLVSRSARSAVDKRLAAHAVVTLNPFSVRAREAGMLRPPSPVAQLQHGCFVKHGRKHCATRDATHVRPSVSARWCAGACRLRDADARPDRRTLCVHDSTYSTPPAHHTSPSLVRMAVRPRVRTFSQPHPDDDSRSQHAAHGRRPSTARRRRSMPGQEPQRSAA